MNSAYLSSTLRYLSSHSEVNLTVTCGAVVTLAAILLLVLREGARVSADGAPAAGVLRRYNVAVIPFLVIIAAVILERFRLIA